MAPGISFFIGIPGPGDLGFFGIRQMHLACGPGGMALVEMKGGIMEQEFYYYLRDHDKRPIVTVCLLKANGDVSRGVAICSELDSPCKKVGRKIAKTRATYAMKSRKSTGHINRTRARGIVSSTWLMQLKLGLKIGQNFNLFNKSEFKPDLFGYELDILGE